MRHSWQLLLALILAAVLVVATCRAESAARRVHAGSALPFNRDPAGQ